MATKGLRKPEKALTVKFVESAKEPGKYFDGHGLFLRVQPNGARQWVQRITIRGKRCELGLGNPALVTLAEARQQALTNRKLSVSGGDPIRAKKEAGAVLTFEKEAEARAKLESLYPVEVKMEQYTGPKTTRVIAILEDEDNWKKKG